MGLLSFIEKAIQKRDLPKKKKAYCDYVSLRQRNPDYPTATILGIMVAEDSAIRRFMKSGDDEDNRKYLSWIVVYGLKLAHESNTPYGLIHYIAARDNGVASVARSIFNSQIESFAQFNAASPILIGDVPSKKYADDFCAGYSITRNSEIYDFISQAIMTRPPKSRLVED